MILAPTRRGTRALAAEDENTVQALLEGSPGAWDAFVERYLGLVVGCARRVLLSRGLRPSGADVDDIAEGVFVMLLEDDKKLLRRYDPAHKLSAYLAVLTRTAAYRDLRKRKTSARLPDTMWQDAVPAQGPEVGAALDRRETRETVQAALEALPERDREILRRFYFDDQDYQQIADSLGLAVNSVGAALSRARKRMGAALTDAGVQE
ncbi:MAG: sigma-70 family RNA polymerase sigma factor [Planctomycetes bacterium]|nr:sigma-70 family RNA polymerase sigma factor [Planctomycetota bacterium]